jgi:hypothetical protein
MARMRWMEAEFIETALIVADELHLIGCRTGLVITGGVHRADKNDGALSELSLQRDVPAGDVAASKFRFFDKKQLVRIQNRRDCLHRGKSSCATKQGLKKKKL